MVLAVVVGIAVCVALAFVWLRAGDPLAQTLRRADDGPVAVNLAEVYGVDASSFAVQCAYQSDEEAVEALGVSSAEDLSLLDAKEVVYFRSADASVTLPANVTLCDGVRKLTWMPVANVCFTAHGEFTPGEKLWRGTVCPQ